MLGNLARVSKPIDKTCEVFLSVVRGKENNHPARASLRDVMRKVWNDDSGDLCQGARVCICLMLLVNCCILYPELPTQRGLHLLQAR